MGRIKQWLKRILGRSQARQQHDGHKTPGGLTLAASQSHGDLISQLSAAVERGDTVNSRVLLQRLREKYPIPAADIVGKEVWGWDTDRLVMRSHAKVDASQAVKNVESSGRKLTPEEQEELYIIMSHSCWWSPTTPDHHDDSWMRYIRFVYPQLQGLQPVLDSLIWPDEIARYPLGHPPLPPWLFLLSTSTRFYVFNFQDACMMDAGGTLQEVLDGMRRKRWHGKEMWPEVPEEVEEDARDYFPVYLNVPHTNEEHELMREVQELQEFSVGDGDETTEVLE